MTSPGPLFPDSNGNGIKDADDPLQRAFMSTLILTVMTGLISVSLEPSPLTMELTPSISPAQGRIHSG